MSKKKISRAGVIPYCFDGGELKILCMRPSDNRCGGCLFQIAKGKIEEGEETEDAAFREAREEIGLFKPNCINIQNLGTFLGRTTIYLAEVKDPSENMFGEPCDETAETKWLTPEEFQEIGRDLHKPVVKAAVRSIEKLCEEIQSNYCPILMEMFGSTKVEFVIKKTNNTITADFVVNQKEFRATIDFDNVKIAPTLTVKVATISFAKVVNDNMIYAIQNDRTVNQFAVAGAVMDFVQSNLPHDVQVLVSAAKFHVGDADRRHKLYIKVIGKFAKWKQFGHHIETLRTEHELMSVAISSMFSDEEENILRTWLRTMFVSID